MPAAELPVDESGRLDALHSLDLLDTPPEERFDRITRLATALFDVPTSLISLVDVDRQWFKSRVGFPLPETERSVSFCAHGVLQPEMLVVEDASADPRFADNAMVVEEPGIRFYAGVPVHAGDERIGTLCIIDQRPRTFSTAERQQLIDLASIVESEIASTKLSQVAEQLGESQSQLEEILVSAGDGILVLDQNGYVNFANPAAASLLRYRTEDLVGIQFHETTHRSIDGDFIPWEDSATHDALLYGEPGRYMSESFLCADGSSFPVDYTITGVRVGAQIVGAVLVFQDATNRREVDSLKDQFVSTVSHELRTPLTSIRGSLGLLNSGSLGPVDPRVQRMIEIAVESTDRLVRLVNDLLDLERLRSGQSTFTPVRVDLKSLLKTAENQARPDAEAAEVSFDVTSVDMSVDLDEDRMLQVLTNLIGNAIKFSQPGGRVSVSVSANSDDILIKVSDEGRGIPKDALLRIFEPFEQVDSSDARTKSGTGLGLSISEGIVNRHGGRVWAESVLGKGSNFYIALPVAQSEVQE